MRIFQVKILIVNLLQKCFPIKIKVLIIEEIQKVSDVVTAKIEVRFSAKQTKIIFIFNTREYEVR